MKKLVLSLAIAGALNLTGCGSDKLDDHDDKKGTKVAVSRVVFNPAGGELSVPSDILFARSPDGTLNMPGEAAETPNFGDPQTALGTLDGWSTQAPFTLEINFPTQAEFPDIKEKVSLDEDSLKGKVRIFPAIAGGPNLGSSPFANEDCVSATSGVLCKIVKEAELKEGTDFRVYSRFDKIVVEPLKPLLPGTQYVVAYTTGIKDTLGQMIESSISYNVLRQDVTKFPISDDPENSALSLQKIINNTELQLLQAGVNPQDVIYSNVFTTQSTTPLSALKGAFFKKHNPTSTIDKRSITVVAAAPATGVAGIDNAVNIFGAAIKADYYLSKTAPLSQAWKSLCDSPASLALLSEEDQAKLVPSNDDAECKKINDTLRDLVIPAEGSKAANEIDTDRYVSKYSPIPKPTEVIDLQVQITIPKVGTEPADGWPVVILQHGITTDKTTMLPVAAALASQGFATVAIDHPLHGARKLPNADAGADPTAYMNLQNLPVARDNLRQSIADLLMLRLGINNLENPVSSFKFDKSNVHFVGHSLGAITGASFVGISNTPLSPEADSMFKIQTASYATPAGGIASFLVESSRFSESVKKPIAQSYALSLIQAATIADTPIGNFINQYKSSENGECSTETKEDMARVCAAVRVEAFGANDQARKLALLAGIGLKDEAATQFLAGINLELNNVYSSFSSAAQTIIDLGDPNSYSAQTSATNTPTFVIEMVGGHVDQASGKTNPADTVIPNMVKSEGMTLSQMAGSTKHAEFIGSSVISSTLAGTETQRSTIQYTAGHHGSILIADSQTSNDEAPDTAANAVVNASILGQVVEFAASGGRSLTISDAAKPFVKSAAAKAEEE